MDSVSALATQLFEGFRIVDLSDPIYPGVHKVDGTYHWGKMRRKFEIRQFVAPGPHFMHFVETESHVGTHVELPSHIVDGAASAMDMPLETFFGACTVLKFDALAPADGSRRMITPEHLRAVRAGDVVLMWSPFPASVPLISVEAARYLADLPIKMVGVQHVGVPDDAHHVLLGKRDAPIPIIEELANLDAIGKERVLFFGFPLRVAELDSSWIRAVALEPR